jgi:predicted phosphodiesterase
MLTSRKYPVRSLKASVALRRYLLVLMLFCPFCIVPAIADGAVDYWAPWVTKIATGSATVNWRGENSGLGSVEYATSTYYNEHHSFQNKIESQTTGAFQHVALTDLEPNTSYIYRVKPSGDKDVFSNRTFRTMPVSGPFTFIVMSDTHAQENRFKYVADAIAKHESDVLFVLDGGDYAGHDDQTLWTIYFRYADGMLAKFPLINTIGNHEYHQPGSAGPPTDAVQYHSSFDIPPKGPLNYSFDCSGVRFVVLNSPDPKHAHGDDPQTSLALARSQEPWLRKQLDNNMAGTFTIHHHPIWDYGRSTINPHLRPWETLYHAYNISANFAGHSHNYQRHSVKGIPYFVVGNAGGEFADINAGAPRPVWYQYGETRQLGYLKVTVDPPNNRATAEEIFVAWVETDGSQTATVYDLPIIADTITFPLSSKLRTLTVTKSGLGSGTIVSSPAAIDCGFTCNAGFRKITSLVLTPAPDSTSFFSGWTGACTGRGQCSVVMDRDITVGAVFEKGCIYSISPGSKIFSYRGGEITVKVTAGGTASCPAPDVVDPTDWIAYTITPFTANKGSVKLSVPEYTGSASRSGTLFIGGNIFAVTQKGKP